jgi:hypothetical protein
MSYEADIYAALQASAPVTAMVGTRIYPDFAPATAVAPFVVYQTVSTDGTTTHDGGMAVVLPLVQFTAWATTRPQANSLSAKIRAALITGDEIPGDSSVFLTFSNETGSRDQETGLFGQILDLRASCNPTT